MQESQIAVSPTDALPRLGLVAYRLRRGPKPVFEAVDDGGRALFGCDLAGKGLATLDALIVSADRARVAACRAAGQWQLVYAVQRADGSRCWIEDRFAGEGGGTGVGVFIDVSARERAHLMVAERESQHQFALAAAGIGVWDADIAGGRFRLSPLARRFFGIPDGAPDPGIQHFADSLHPDDRQRVLASIDGHLRAHSGFDEEFRLRTPTGGWRWFHSHGAGIGDEARRRAIGIVTDVTVRRMSDQILRDSEARLRAVLTHVSEAILTIDAEGRVRSANAAAERMFGWREHEIIGLPLTDLVPRPSPTSSGSGAGIDAGSPQRQDAASGHPPVADREIVPDRQVCADAVSRPAPDRKIGHDRQRVADHKVAGDWEAAYAGPDHVGHHRDGRTFAVEIALARMLIGNAEMFTAVVRDVSASRRAAAELREAKERAEAAARAKSAFLAMMSHELRTPLNGVLGMARLLAEMSPGAEQAEAVAAITQSGEALLAIVDDVLDAARIDAGRLVVRHEPFDLAGVVREVVTLLAARIAERGLELIVDYEPALPRQLVGDAGRVRQVLWNLVGNAIKFTETGHVAVRVRVDGRSLAIAVEDTGVGIEPAFQARLFEAFEQADTSLTRRHGGTGLGLAISRQLVALFGGTLSCVSHVGIGSTFRFTLPLPAANDGVSQASPVLPAMRSVVLTVPYGAAAEVLVRDLMVLGFGVRRAPTAAVAMVGTAGAEAAGAWVVDWSALDAERLDDYRLAGASVLLPLAAQRWRAALEARGARVLMKPTFVADLVRLLGVKAVTAAPRAPVTGRPRALVADDNHVNQRVALRLLERLGYDVDVADDGAQALSHWRHGGYAVVLMDCQMPVMDGFAATAAIRGEERAGRRAAGTHTRIVAMTANALADDVHDCLAAGMDAHVAKPVSIEKLAAALGGAAVQAPAGGAGAAG